MWETCNVRARLLVNTSVPVWFGLDKQSYRWEAVAGARWALHARNFSKFFIHRTIRIPPDVTPVDSKLFSISSWLFDIFPHRCMSPKIAFPQIAGAIHQVQNSRTRTSEKLLSEANYYIRMYAKYTRFWILSYCAHNGWNITDIYITTKTLFSSPQNQIPQLSLIIPLLLTQTSLTSWWQLASNTTSKKFTKNVPARTKP